MANIILRSRGWTSIHTQDLAKSYSDLSTRLGSLDLSFAIAHEPETNDLTYAENFGRYVRELFLVYTAILEEMKSSREWIVLQVRSTYHSKADFSDAIIIGDENDPDQIQVRGFRLDTLVFDFPWQDNSMEHPWKPWNWQIGVLPDDLDEVHYFFDLKSEKLFIGADKKLSFCKMRPNFPQKLTLFRLS